MSQFDKEQRLLAAVWNVLQAKDDTPEFVVAMQRMRQRYDEVRAAPSHELPKDFVCLKEPRCKAPCGNRHCHTVPPLPTVSNPPSPPSSTLPPLGSTASTPESDADAKKFLDSLLCKPVDGVTYAEVHRLLWLALALQEKAARVSATLPMVKPWWKTPVRYDKDKGYFIDAEGFYVALARVNLKDELNERIAQAINAGASADGTAKP